MSIGDTAKRHHPGSWTRRQGWEFRSYSPMTQPQPQPWLSWWCLSDSFFFGTVFVNSWDQKKCPVDIASHMDAHSFCFVLFWRRWEMSASIPDIVWCWSLTRKTTWLCSLPLNVLSSFCQGANPSPQLFPSSLKVKYFLFPFRDSEKGTDCWH